MVFGMVVARTPKFYGQMLEFKAHPVKMPTELAILLQNRRQCRQFAIDW